MTEPLPWCGDKGFCGLMKGCIRTKGHPGLHSNGCGPPWPQASADKPEGSS